MTDSQLIDLYQTRSEDAIGETQKRYGAYCRAIAMNVLHNAEDADECVNDVYLSVWNLIPPQSPTSFSSFIGRITRNISLDKFRKNTSQKRGGGGADLLFSELEACIPARNNVEEGVVVNLLSEAVDSFLSTLSQSDMTYFMSRYWYGCGVCEIAGRFKVGESKVKVSLHRTRKKLRTYLETRGYLQ
ncbi:MAG: sigma-70 family RNA polymerase sigma factor [Oscillospiraceae bacterium]|nr:sigma-70 family RNA polymerase sigma factor [Oscillospiraceae bacterium]